MTLWLSSMGFLGSNHQCQGKNKTTKKLQLVKYFVNRINISWFKELTDLNPVFGLLETTDKALLVNFTLQISEQLYFKSIIRPYNYTLNFRINDAGYINSIFIQFSQGTNILSLNFIRRREDSIWTQLWTDLKI